MRPPTHILARLGLWPLSLLYRGMVRLRATAYQRGWLSAEQIPIPVISVGNLSVGGTGKTPLVAKICSLLGEAGWRTAVVSRGYGRRDKGAVTVVSRGDGRGPLVSPALAGDEPFLLARQLPHSIVVTASDRAAGGRLAARELDAQVVVADDAFQHLRLARDLDLLVVDATNPIHAGWLLPAGALREPPEAASRAHAFLVSRCDRIGETTNLETIFRQHNSTAPFFHTVARPVELVLPDGNRAEPQALQGDAVAAFCGIGSPRFFLQDLERMGAHVQAFVTFPDHHWYADADLEDLARRARDVGASWLITTEKDFVRLSEAQRAIHPLCRLRIEAEIWEERKLRKFLLRHLKREAVA